jgi:U3 small nucleolar RNA-associated protein 19
LLLQNHGLDYPKYYEKLYALLLPQKVEIEVSDTKTYEIVSVFSSVDHETKTRFLRVLDLSLRSPILPSKLIAAFIKRLGRILVSHGSMLSVNETMFAVA